MTSPAGEDLDARLAGLAAFADPVRRALYRYVIERGVPVSRDEAAAGVGVARHVAKFHLDRLEAEGLLDAEARRPPGRGGPGAGRPAKLYRRSARQIELSIPERRYELAGRILAEAVTESVEGGVGLAEALDRTANEVGRTFGAAARDRAGRRPGSGTVDAAVLDVLREVGCEPRDEPGGITLENCPFHALAQQYTELICGLNLALIRGVLSEAGSRTLEARLDPEPGRCCVRLRT